MLRRSQGSNSSRGIQEIDAISALYCPGLKVMSSPIHRSDDDDQPLDRAAARPAGLGPSFSGDRALVEFNRQLSRTADLVPEPPLALDPKDSGPESQWSMARRFLGLVGIAAAIAWGIVLLPTLRKPATVASQTDSRQAPNDASPAQLADAAPNTGGPPPAQNGFPTVNQPQVVTLIPISKPPAATAPNGPPLATLPAAPVAKSVSAAASAASSSPQPSPDLTAQARATASPVPASPQPQAQPAPASPQPVASVTPSTPSEPPGDVRPQQSRIGAQQRRDHHAAQSRQGLSCQRRPIIRAAAIPAGCRSRQCRSCNELGVNLRPSLSRRTQCGRSHGR